MRYFALSLLLLSSCGVRVPDVLPAASAADGNAADALDCLWSAKHRACLCSADWSDTHASVIVLPATSYGSCL